MFYCSMDHNALLHWVLTMSLPYITLALSNEQTHEFVLFGVFSQYYLLGFEHQKNVNA
jgi:hypothetical protein